MAKARGHSRAHSIDINVHCSGHNIQRYRRSHFYIYGSCQESPGNRRNAHQPRLRRDPDPRSSRCLSVRDVVVGCLSFRYAVYLRHHGFPSPLLDWSLSPYVAAYFAFVDATDRQDARNGGEEGESRVAIYVMRPPKRPYKRYIVGSDALPGDEAGIRYWPNPVKGERRHYDQQSAYTTALRAKVEDARAYFFDSHEYILRGFPQTLVPGTNLVTYEHAIDQVVCWKLTIPQRERERGITAVGQNEHKRLHAVSHRRYPCEDLRQRELHGAINAT